MSKHCTYCKKDKELEEFDTKKNGSFYAHCKICRFKNQQSYHKNKKCKTGYCINCFKLNIYKRATFGFLDDKKMISCSEHKTEGMIDLAHMNNGCLICLDEKGIFKRASFGFIHDEKKISCSEHKIDGMINLTDMNRGCFTCLETGIFKQSCFGFLHDKKRIACAEHKTEGMINLTDMNRGCLICLEEKGIFKQSAFGFIHDKKKISCSDHKTEGMINLVNINNGCFTCLEENKFKQASFGYLYDKKRISCSEHKTEGMINLTDMNRGCLICLEEKNKFKIASFGFLHDKKIISCSDHKKDGMIDLQNMNSSCLTCKKEDKFKRASFGFPHDKKKISCSDHKTEEMIDLVNRNSGCLICKEENKFKQASYGYLFEKKTHCAIHKKPNMYSSNNPTCSECPEKPFYGDQKLNDTPVRCEKHKLDTDSDLISRKCDLCKDEYFIPSDKTKCRGCRGFVIRKNSKRGVKEKKIADLLMSLTKTLGKPVHDKKVKGGCSNKRPDFYYSDFNPSFSLIVEVDENQHSSYTCGIQAEMERIINIYENDNGGFPLCIVRFNPDSYYYKDKAVKAYKGREDVLKQVICGLKNRSGFDHKIGVIYLFYDNFDTITGIDIKPFDYKYEDGKLVIDHKHPLSIKKQHIYNL